MAKGKLIVIDGIDGSGKTTQIELLSEYLKNKNIPFEVISFPRYEGFYGQLIKRYLEGEFGSLHTVSPYLIALAYASDRLLAKPLIESWIQDGTVVIANRYVSASKAHLGANLSEDQREEFMEWIDNLEYKTNKMPKPDLNILLKVDSKIGQGNALHKNKPDVKDIHEESEAHLEKAAQIYLELSKAEENWVVVDCMEGDLPAHSSLSLRAHPSESKTGRQGNMKPPQKIHQEILQLLESKIF